MTVTPWHLNETCPLRLFLSLKEGWWPLVYQIRLDEVAIQSLLLLWNIQTGQQDKENRYPLLRCVQGGSAAHFAGE
jgi:hypothetical protein